MKKNIIKIDENKCIGCAACASTCHQSAISMVNGVAKVSNASQCDGLGRCLPVCPADAISFVQEEITPVAFTPRSISKEITKQSSELLQWPIQIQLMPIQASYYDKAHLLVAADCSAFAHPNFQSQFMKGKITMIGCPKLDPVQYHEKLSAILQHNDIASIHVVRMEVPCCGGIEYAVNKALSSSMKNIALQVTTLTTKGVIKE